MFTDGDPTNLSANLSFPSCLSLSLSLSIGFLSIASLPPEDSNGLERAGQGFGRDLLYFFFFSTVNLKRGHFTTVCLKMLCF